MVSRISGGNGEANYMYLIASSDKRLVYAVIMLWQLSLASDTND